MSDVLHTFHGRYESLAERCRMGHNRRAQYAWLTANNTRRIALHSDNVRAFDLTATWAEGEWGPCIAVHAVLAGDSSGALHPGRDARMVVPVAIAKRLAWSLQRIAVG